MTTTIDDVLLDKIDALTAFKLANMLDLHTERVNIWAASLKKGWRELAALVYFNTIDYNRCEMAPAMGRSSAQEMLNIVIQRFPNKTFTWLHKKLCLIERSDAAALLHAQKGTPKKVVSY